LAHGAERAGSGPAATGLLPLLTPIKYSDPHRHSQVLLATYFNQAHIPLIPLLSACFAPWRHSGSIALDTTLSGLYKRWFMCPGRGWYPHPEVVRAGSNKQVFVS